jgi:hypothetical protein
MARIQGLFERNGINTSDVIKACRGELHSISVSWKGLNVGDVVCQVFDSPDAAGTSDPSKIVWRVVADAAGGNASKNWPQGKLCENGIFYQEGAPGGPSGSIIAELTAK